MSQPMPGSAVAAAGAAGVEAWSSLADCLHRVPERLRPWLAEPGLLTARVRAACGEATVLRMLRLEPAPLAPHLGRRLGVADTGCLLREVEINCGATRWVFAQSVFPDSTVARHPWLADLGDNGLGEALSAVTGVVREPLEYLELAPSHELVRAAQAGGATARPLWARRAIYRLDGWPILVQEVFLPGLDRCG